MAVELASAYLSLIPSLKGAQGAIAAELGGTASIGTEGGKKLGGGIVGGLKGALGPVAAITAGVFATSAIVGWGKEQIESLKRIETLNAQSASAIKATGGAANVTSQHIQDLTGSLENSTATEAESIQQGANLLLTFKNLKNGVGAGNDVFDQTVKVMTDMGRAMGTDPQSSAIQLGKALNDPVKGIAALSRVGVTFTEDQKKVIASLVESGDVMGAQKIILNELNSEFGGAGAAYAATYAGKVDLLGHAWGTFGETLFQNVTPALGGVASGLTGLLNNVLTPLSGAVSTGLTSAFAVAKNAAVGFFSGFKNGVDDLGTMQGFWPGWGAEVAGVFSKVQDAARTAFGQIAPAFATLGPVFAGLVPQLLELASSLSPTAIVFRSLQPVLPTLVDALTQVGVALGQVLTASLSTLLPLVVSMTTSLSSGLTTALVAILPPLTSILVALLQVVTPVLASKTAIIGLAGAFVAWKATMLGISLAGLIAGLVASTAASTTNTRALIAGTAAKIADRVATVALIAMYAGQFVATLASSVAAIAAQTVAVVASTAAAVAARVAMVAGAVATGAATAAQWLFNAALSANPIGIVIVAVAALVAAFVWFFTQTKTGQAIFGAFSAFLRTAWDAVVAGVGAAARFLGTLFVVQFNAMRAAVSFLVGGVRAMASGVVAGFNSVVGAGQAMASGIGGAISSAVSFVAGLPGRAAAALGDLGSRLYSSGQALIQGFINGIRAMIGRVGDAVGGVLDFAKGFFPNSPADRGPFSGAGWKRVTRSGGAIMDAFADGFPESVDLTGALGGAIPTVAQLTPSLRVTSAASSGVGADMASVAEALLPDHMTLVDETGALLGRMRVVADERVQAGSRARGIALQTGTRVR